MADASRNGSVLFTPTPAVSFGRAVKDGISTSSRSLAGASRSSDCKLIVKLGTTALHLGIAAMLLALEAWGGAAATGTVTLQICVLHVCLLLGMWGPTPGSGGRFLWVPSPIHEVKAVALLFLVGIVEFIGVALLYYADAEKHGTFAGGTFIDRLWFCFVLLTTVGYGNTFVPSSPNSRTFTVMWALYGLFIFGAGSNLLAAAVSDVLTIASAGVQRVRSALREQLGTPSTPPAPAQIAPVKPQQPAAVADANGTVDDSAFEPPDIYYVAKSLFSNFVCFVALNTGGACIFWQLEAFEFVDAFYHCVMTATTIGLGDIAPQTQAGRAYGIVHMILSVLLFGSMYAYAATAPTRDDDGSRGMLALMLTMTDAHVRCSCSCPMRTSRCSRRAVLSRDEMWRARCQPLHDP
jgi:hypothetical protein